MSAPGFLVPERTLFLSTFCDPMKSRWQLQNNSLPVKLNHQMAHAQAQDIIYIYIYCIYTIYIYIYNYIYNIWDVWDHLSNSSLDLPSGPFSPTPANTAMPGQKELFIPGTPKSQGEGLLLDIKELISISLYLHFMYLVYLVFTSCVCVQKR